MLVGEENGLQVSYMYLKKADDRKNWEITQWVNNDLIGVMRSPDEGEEAVASIDRRESD